MEKKVEIMVDGKKTEVSVPESYLKRYGKETRVLGFIDKREWKGVLISEKVWGDIAALHALQKDGYVLAAVKASETRNESIL